MNSQPNDASLRFRRAPAHCRAESLWLLWSRESPETRRDWLTSVLLRGAERTESLRGLLEARRAKRLVGAAWAEVLPGHMANVWPPRLIDNEDACTADGLLKWLDHFLHREQVHLAQALPSPGCLRDAEVLERNGFSKAADLLYLVWCRGTPIPRVHTASSDDTASGSRLGGFIVEPYSPESRRRLALIIEQTYIETLDIPAMNGLRSIDDVLDGYCLSIADENRHWFILTNQDEDVGCLLLADHALYDQVELVYMGIVPKFRGRRWGERVARYAQDRASETLGRNRLVLAVDAQNSPAISLYFRLGFSEWDRREVYLRSYAAVQRLL